MLFVIRHYFYLVVICGKKMKNLNAFKRAFDNSRNKKHGVGKAPIKQAIMLGLMAQYVSWGSPKWFALCIPTLLCLLYVPIKESI